MEDRTPLKMRGGGGSRQIDDACAGKGGTLTLDQASAVQCSAACTCLLVRVSQSRAVSLLLHLCARERESARARTGVPLYVSMSLDFCFLAHLARFALCTTALLYQFYIDGCQ